MADADLMGPFITGLSAVLAAGLGAWLQHQFGRARATLERLPHQGVRIPLPVVAITETYREFDGINHTIRLSGTHQAQDFDQFRFMVIEGHKQDGSLISTPQAELRADGTWDVDLVTNEWPWIDSEYKLISAPRAIRNSTARIPPP